MEKTYRKSKYELHLLAVLMQMEAEGIKTLEDLQAEENARIYTTLWFAVEDFVNHVALRTKNHRTGDDRYREGNAPHLRELLEMGVDLEDLQGGVLLRIMEKMTWVLDRPVAAQIPYCITVCTNWLVDEYRKRCPDGKRTLSLNKPLGQDGDSEYTLGDITAAPDNTEEWVVACDTVLERIQAEQCRGRQEILEDLAHLRSGDEALVYLCMYEQMRPRRIYEAIERLAASGCTPQDSSAILSAQICRKYAICRSEKTAVLDKPLSRSMVKHLCTRDREIITNKISDVKFAMPQAVKARLKSRQQGGAVRK